MRTFAALILAMLVAACTPTGDPEVTNATYRPPLGGSPMGVAYLTITSPRADKIIAISSSAAEKVEMHETNLEGGMASMHLVETVELKAGKPLEFKPGGLHLMIHNPQAMGPENAFPVTIELESGRILLVNCAAPGDAGSRG